MLLTEFESKFQKEETLVEVLNYLQKDIERIEYYSDLFKSGVVADNPVEIANALTELTGIYMNLRPRMAIAVTEKDNRELRAYHAKKMALEKAGEKFTSAATEKEASLEVAAYRRIRNIIEAYVESLEKAIGIGQSLLKSVNREMNVPQGN